MRLQADHKFVLAVDCLHNAAALVIAIKAHAIRRRAPFAKRRAILRAHDHRAEAARVRTVHRPHQ